MKNFLKLASAILPAAFVGAATVTRTITVSNKNIAPDGFTRSGVVADGVFPAPPIIVNKGDRLVFTVQNRLTDPTMRRSTSLNLDGVFINGPQNFQEGQSYVAQCPIAPGDTYVQDVQLDPNQAGTFWYHSQLSVQYVDGFRGPLIIKDPRDPQAHLYDVDNEGTVIQLADWWHNSSVDVFAFFAAHDMIPVADTGLINGVGRFNGGPAIPFAVVNVAQNKRYRLRVINESARSAYNFSIDSHNFTIIEADGVNTNPITGNQVQILAGQRYSVVLNANQPVANYWINAPFTGGNAAANPNQNVTFSRAILRYAGAPKADPTTPLTEGPTGSNLHFVTEAQISPLVRSPPPEPDITLIFNVAFTPGQNGTGWRINNISYQPDHHNPTLVKVLQQGASQPQDFNVSDHTIILPQNKTVEVQFPSNDDDELHPFHMHGMNFWVIKPDSGTTNNTVNPIIRDTTGSGAAGTIVRFRTDKVGAWIYHCHIMWHMQAGLGSVMLVDPNATRATVRPAVDWDALCPAYNALPPDEQ